MHFVFWAKQERLLMLSPTPVPRLVQNVTYSTNKHRFWRFEPLFSVFLSVANLATLSLDLATFQTPLATFFFNKRLATNLATFGKTLATFQMWPVLSCEREILSYTSRCVCSDQWALAPAERSSTFQWPHGSWHRCQWAAHVHTVLPRTNHLAASPLFEIKLINLTGFSSTFFFFFSMHLYYSLSQSFSSFQFLNSSKIVYWATSERLYVIVLTHTQQ